MAEPDPRSSQPGPQPTAPQYRLSDAERDEAISALADAFADGRLDAAEFSRRMAAASEAVYASELDPLFVDLIRPRATRTPAPNARTRPAPAAGVPMRTPRGHHHRPVLLAPLFLALGLMLLLGGHFIGALVMVALVVHFTGGHRRRQLRAQQWAASRGQVGWGCGSRARHGGPW